MIIIIEIKNTTKVYKSNKGVKNININFPVGQAIGILGPNGAGKTTLIRMILGFTKPDVGEILINKTPVWKNNNFNLNNFGYVSGENIFPEMINVKYFLNFLQKIKGNIEEKKLKALIKYFELDTRGTFKKMSKGMKQKVALINAFMGKNEFLILDEPTSGLDPLMREKVIDLVKSEKYKNKTIIYCSHIVEEIEKICDIVLILKDNRIFEVVDLKKEKDLIGKYKKIYQLAPVQEVFDYD